MRLGHICYTVSQTAQKCPKLNPTKKFFRTTHCLFDLDGTLLDTQDSYERSCSKIFKKYGEEFTPEWHNKMLQLSSKQFWKEFHHACNLPRSCRLLVKEFEDIYKEHIKKAPLKAGVERLICHLHHYNVPMALVTSSSKEFMEWKTRNIKYLIAMFNHVVCADGDDSVKKLKPKPDIYLVCASRFLERPVYGNCLVFEGTPRGIASAVAAGMQCVAVPNQSISREMCRSATIVMNSFMEFEPYVFGLPPFTLSCH